jgi:hypothetical protein
MRKEKQGEASQCDAVTVFAVPITLVLLVFAATPFTLGVMKAEEGAVFRCRNAFMHDQMREEKGRKGMARQVQI